MTDRHTYIHTYRKWVLNVLSDVKMATKDVYKWEENSDFTKCEALGSREINCDKLTQELKK